MKITSSHINLRGLDFEYRAIGEPASPPLVLLHALSKDASDWDAVAKALGARFRVLALTQRGHGRSCRTPDYSFELMRDDALAFVDALGVERFSLIGHSMGGTVACLMAEAQPDRIQRLVLEDTAPPSGNVRVAEPAAEPPRALRFDWGLMGPLMRQINRPDPSWWEDLPRITAPTLVVAGGRTSRTPETELVALAGRLEDCHVVTLEGAGHQVHQNRLAEFLTAVEEFLEPVTTAWHQPVGAPTA